MDCAAALLNGGSVRDLHVTHRSAGSLPNGSSRRWNSNGNDAARRTGRQTDHGPFDGSDIRARYSGGRRGHGRSPKRAPCSLPPGWFSNVTSGLSRRSRPVASRRSAEPVPPACARWPPSFSQYSSADPGRPSCFQPSWPRGGGEETAQSLEPVRGPVCVVASLPLAGPALLSR